MLLAAASGCDLSYLTAGSGGATSSTTTDNTGGTPTGSAGTGGSTAAGGTGGSTATGGSGGAPVETALRWSAAFGDPAQNDDLLAQTGAGSIRVAGLGDGSVVVAFHAAGSNIVVPGGQTFAADQTKAPSDRDLFVVHLDATGTPIKTLHLSMPGDQTLGALAVAGPSGPVYIGGRTTAPLVLPGLGDGVTIPNSGADGFVLALDMALAVSAAAVLTGAGSQDVQSLTAGVSGDLWVGGQLASTATLKGADAAGGPVVDLGCATLSYATVKGESGGLVAHLSGDLAACKLAFSFGPTQAPKKVDVETSAIVATPGGDLYVAGRFAGAMAVGPAPAVQSADDAGFVVKLGANAASSWSAVLESAGGNDRITDLTLSPQGVVAIGQTGTLPAFAWVAPGAGQATGPCVPGTAASSNDGLVATLDSGTGACTWGVRLSSGQPQATVEVPRAVARAAGGALWVTGTFEEQLLLDGAPPAPGLDHGSPWESFALRLKEPGAETVTFAQAWSGDGDQLARDIGLLPGGRIVVAGSYTGKIPGGAPALPSAASDPHDYFLLMIDPAYPAASF